MDFDYVVMPVVIVVLALIVDGLGLRYAFAVSRRPLRRGQKAIRLVGAWAAMMLASSVATLSAYNAIAMHAFWVKHPPAGEFEAVNGARMYIHCMGEGSPALVLDSGLGDDSMMWAQLQPVLSKTTRVCAYDRAGFGGSEPTAGPQDADQIVEALHGLLGAASISGPVVLMGHSIAGIYIRDYAVKYPEDVAGLIFVDASTPFQDRKMGVTMGGGPPPWLLQFAMIVGVPRLIGMCSSHGSGENTDYPVMKSEDRCRMYYPALAMELRAFGDSSGEASRRSSFGSLPVLIFSHDPFGTLPRKPQSADEKKRQGMWDGLQENLKSLSTRSRRIIVTGGTHHLFEERPQLVVDEVTAFLEQIRGTAPQPTTYGSTTRE
ncbi:alpha/beta fold hydrolase [Silvibacterium dinghuense]|nr:alpha/beta hydrolase [Silvibacterium dinghuense]GGH07440.1 hypothetical protein GCM10011586_24700 [Silvibacterium dinghuense]